MLLTTFMMPEILVEYEIISNICTLMWLAFKFYLSFVTIFIRLIASNRLHVTNYNRPLVEIYILSNL